MEDTELELDKLYASIKKVNNELLEKSSYAIYDTVDFSEAMQLILTSNALSVIKSVLQGNYQSKTCYFNLRNMMEAYSLLIMNDRGDISDINKKLFNKQYAIFEYMQYDIGDSDIFKGLNDFEDLVKRFNDAKQAFLDAGVSEEDFKALTLSRAPFLLDKKFNFNKIINKYISKEAGDMYSRLSIQIHPSSYAIKENEEFLRMAIALNLTLLKYLYQDVDVDRMLEYSVEQVVVYGFGHKSPKNYPKRLFEYQAQQHESLLKISSVFEKIYSQDSYPAQFFKDIAYILYDINTDSQLGYTENAKMKFKVMSEYFAVFDKVYFGVLKNINYYKLMRFHDRYEYDRYFDRPLEQEIFDKAYDVYVKECKGNASKEIFEKAFRRNLGYLITAKGESIGFNRLVREYYQSLRFNKIKGTSIPRWKLYCLTYKESQAMSHGGGYLFFANTGAWMDDINVVVALDLFILNLIEKMQLFFKVFKDENNRRVYKVLRDEYKTFQLYTKKKIEIFSTVPRIRRPI